jgi:lipopolysaccharide cholinephosphotransferase
MDYSQETTRSPAYQMKIDFQAAPEALRKLQMVELDMLIVIDRLCSKHHITYYLTAGSALGAARHLGFIPWDGDVDIGMPRQDYERFLQLCSTELPAGLFLQTHQTDPYYFRHFAKIRNENTTFVQWGARRLKYNHGVFIDIAPLDGAPSSQILQYMQAATIRLSAVFGTLRYVARYSHHVFKRVLALLSLCIPYDFWFALGERAARWIQPETARSWGNLFGHYSYGKQVMPREYFGTPRRVKFEGHDLPVPQQLDAYLKHLYGDYLKLPSVEQRENYDACILDLENSYLNYPPWSSLEGLGE